MNLLHNKSEARRLWELCFEDSALFVDFYFEHVYPTALNYIDYDPELPMRAIAQMQVIPYDYQFWQSVAKAGYISGACTDPNYRSKGLMSKMLSQALNDLYEQGFEFSFLIPAEPWLFDYYHQKAAYVLSATRQIASYVKRNTNLSADFRLIDSYPSYEFYRTQVREMNDWLPVLHSKHQWQLALQDMALANGKVYSLVDAADAIRAQAYFLPSDEVCPIRVLIGEKDMQEQLIQMILQKEGRSQINSLQAPTADANPYAMLRIVNAKRALEIFALANPSLSMRFDLLDRQIPANSGHYCIEDAKLSFEPIPKLKAGVNISELSAMILPSTMCTPILMMD